MPLTSSTYHVTDQTRETLRPDEWYTSERLTSLNIVSSHVTSDEAYAARKDGAEVIAIEFGERRWLTDREANPDPDETSPLNTPWAARTD